MFVVNLGMLNLVCDAQTEDVARKSSESTMTVQVGKIQAWLLSPLFGLGRKKQP